MTDDGIVWMNRAGQSRVFHTHPECSYLPSDPSQVREVDRAAVESHYSACEICEGEQPFGGWHHGDGDTSVYDAAKNADPEAWDRGGEL